MRVLKTDFAKYNVSDDEEMDDIHELDHDEVGWKIYLADVFCFPPYKSWLCAILGEGSQFLTLCFGIIFLAFLGLFNVHREIDLVTKKIFFTFLGISGYVSSNFYRKIGGTNWVWNVVLTTSIFSVPFFMIWSVINSTAWYYQSTQALPYTTIILLMLNWLIVGFPLTILGGIFGKNWAGSFNSPCRTKNIPREIPPIPWYRSTLVRMVVGGFLPFRFVYFIACLQIFMNNRRFCSKVMLYSKCDLHVQ
ncbi:transmembrane 9 superfamily member 1-like [Stylophora pistillata]|uniref:transmembrane 9 superfamily member 1-like n=1 Tax=Stylophora pistillata TaxID=50429 RepID=UPI000C04860E|nr:transmembrane 9 superfamily member 1-like [Stylophora pistillata]